MRPVLGSRSGDLNFVDADFKASADFTRSRLANLRFVRGKWATTCGGSGDDAGSGRVYPSSQFAMAAMFDDVESGNAVFCDVHFLGGTYFRGASFGTSSEMDGVSFGGETDWSDIRFSRGSDGSAGFTMHRVSFNQALRAEWASFKPGFFGDPIVRTDDGWSGLAQAFDRTGNLDAKNKCLYQNDLHPRKDPNERSVFTRFVITGWRLVQQWGWGFGYQPQRVVINALMVVVLFGIIYFLRANWRMCPETEHDLGVHFRQWPRGRLRRLVIALGFSLRSIRGVKPCYRLKHSTASIQKLWLIEWWLMKAAWILFLIALSRYNTVFHQLVEGLLSGR